MAKQKFIKGSNDKAWTSFFFFSGKNNIWVSTLDILLI